MLYHGKAEVVQILEPTLITEEGVPYSDGVGYIEVLTDQQHEPSDGEELRMNLMPFQVFVQSGVTSLYHLSKLVDLPSDA